MIRRPWFTTPAWLGTDDGKKYAKFVAAQRTAVVDFETDSEQIETSNIQKIKHEAPLAEANSVASLRLPLGAPKLVDGTPTHFVGEATHIPVLDLDMDAMLVPSSTTGHHHLYINHPMPWSDYSKLLKVLGEVGILQKGYVRASLAREASWLRTPWTRKEVNDSGSC